MDKKEQARLRKQRQRDRESVTKQENNVTQSPESVTQAPENVTPDVTQYPAILHAITDPSKRLKLEKLYRSCKEHNVDKLVFYGYPGLTGVPFDEVGELLEATKP